MEAATVKIASVEPEAEQKDASTKLEDCNGIEFGRQDEGTERTSTGRNYGESKTLSGRVDHEQSQTSSPCLSPARLKLVETLALAAVVVLVWLLLALPIVFYHLPSVSSSCWHDVHGVTPDLLLCVLDTYTLCAVG